ncbi:hypothetical protein [Streptomyces sp. NPDC051546]|uniref:hypothetical protein n=1 Tax=Streptomyces sp. NPDC051546 TaxID=3365655 RepID=UPI0037BCA1C0
MAASFLPEDDQNLWRSVYAGPEHGWSPDVAFADHLSIAAPALADMDGTLVCLHRGARQEEKKYLPLRWTSYDPAASKPFADKIAALGEQQAGVDDAEAFDKAFAEFQQASEALEQSRKWVPDADVAGQSSYETPALAFHNGVLHAVYTEHVIGKGGVLRHTQYRTGGTAWSKAETVPAASLVGSQAVARAVPLEPEDDPKLAGTRFWSDDHEFEPSAPALVSHGGELHLLWVGLTNSRIYHMIYNDKSGWDNAYKPVVKGRSRQESPGIIAPVLGYADEPQSSWTAAKTAPYPANLAVAAHEGRLHLAFRREPDDGMLWHSVFDGTHWSAPALMQGHLSRRGTALASHGGILHAVYPAANTEQLHHATFTNDAWGKAQPIDGHNSKNTPALLAFTQGEGEPEGLLLVHRGVDRYVPPPPRTYVPPKAVKTHGEPQIVRMTDYSTGASSKADHQLAATAATFDNGTQGITATFSADFSYWWLWGYYSDSGTVRGSIKIMTPKGIQEQEFSGDFTSSYEATVNFTDLAPGSYEVWMGSKTRKTGGYKLEVPDDTKSQRYAAIDIHPIRVQVTIPQP